MKRGYISLWRKILDWEWYDEPLTTRLFEHLLLIANHEDNVWRGITVKRGQLVTWLNDLSKQTGISVRSIRTGLERLTESKCIDKQTTNKYTLITICNYDSYQFGQDESDKQTTNKRQTNDKQTTDINNNENNINNIYSSPPQRMCAHEESQGSLIESTLWDWKASDIVDKQHIPPLTSIWIEEVQMLVFRHMKLQLSENEVNEQYEDFKAQEATETLQTTYGDWRKHFSNYVRKSIKIKNDERDIKAAQDYNSSEARAKRQEGYARVMQKLIAEGQQPKKDDNLPF